MPTNLLPGSRVSAKSAHGHGTTRMPRSWRFVPIRVAGCGSVSRMRAHRRRRAPMRAMARTPKRWPKAAADAATTTTTRTTLRRPAPSRLAGLALQGRRAKFAMANQGDGREEARRRPTPPPLPRAPSGPPALQDGDGQDGSRRADITLRSGPATKSVARRRCATAAVIKDDVESNDDG